MIRHMKATVVIKRAAKNSYWDRASAGGLGA